MNGATPPVQPSSSHAMVVPASPQVASAAMRQSAVVPVSAQLPMVNAPETEGVNFRYFGALITCGLNGKVQALPVMSKSGKD